MHYIKMAAPLRKWLLRRTPAILSRFATTTEILGPQTKYRLKVDKFVSLSSERRSLTRFIPLVSSLFFRSLQSPKVNSDSGGSDSRRRLSDHRDPFQPDDNNRRPLKLMDFEELIWPSPMKSIRNAFFSFLIRCYFDEHFSSKTFLDGSEQGINVVSNLISSGQFSELDGLVTREAQREIKRNYDQLSVQQQKFIAVNPSDIFFRFVHEIGIILDDKTNERFVEITAVFQGVHGLEDAKMRNPDSFSEELREAHDKVYVCNYRLVREYTKGKEDDWIINKLNHFKAKELVDRSDLFQR